MELLSTLENHLFPGHLVAIEDDYKKIMNKVQGANETLDRFPTSPSTVLSAQK